MSEPEKVRVSFIGAGGICEQRHLPGLAQIPDVELVAVCNRSLESSERIKQKWNLERIESDWRKVIDDSTVDAIFIGTWPYLHRELSIAALNSGKHVFCQARMCMNWNEAQQMTAAAAAHPQQVNMVCPSPFRVRWERTVKRVLASPEFGPLRRVGVYSASDANLDPQKYSWREQTEYSGLNILQVGIFAETLNAWCGEYENCSAVAGVPRPEKFDSAGRRCETRVPQIVSLNGILKSGVKASEFYSGLSKTPASQITLYGKQQTCTVDLLAEEVSLLLNDREIVDTVGDPWQVEADFIAAVRAALFDNLLPVRTINPDFLEAAAYIRKMQAIHDSNAARQSIPLAGY